MKKFFVLFAAVALICAFAMPAAAMEEKTPEERIAAWKPAPAHGNSTALPGWPPSGRFRNG